MRLWKFGVLAGGLAAAAIWLSAQESALNIGAGTNAKTPVFRSKVDLVVLSFTVTDNKGKYVNGLKPSDFRILEDGIPEKMSTFSEGNRPAMEIEADGSLKPMLLADSDATRVTLNGGDTRSDAFVGTNVFVLFDTSNFMYHGFVYAEDAIADFVR